MGSRYTVFTALLWRNNLKFPPHPPAWCSAHRDGHFNNVKKLMLQNVIKTTQQYAERCKTIYQDTAGSSKNVLIQQALPCCQWKVNSHTFPGAGSAHTQGLTLTAQSPKTHGQMLPMGTDITRNLLGFFWSFCFSNSPLFAEPPPLVQ